MVDQRRDLSAALKLTPEATEFIQGGVSQSPAVSKPRAKVAAAPKTHENRPAQPPAKKSQPRRNPKPAESSAKLVTTSRARVAITTRFCQETADALRRASLERKLRGESLQTQQDIIEQAVQQWLTAAKKGKKHVDTDDVVKLEQASVD